jgi:hypothetical protein
LRSFADLVARCNAANTIAPFLEAIQSDSTTWMSVLRCKVCGQIWVRESPFAEHHGGGAPCYYQVAVEKPEMWLATASPVTDALRREGEDAAFLANLGEERGPEPCRHAECKRLRVSQSVFCRTHHFENIFRRPPAVATD